jgi:hypothetical protein
MILEILGKCTFQNKLYLFVKNSPVSGLGEWYNILTQSSFFNINTNVSSLLNLDSLFTLYSSADSTYYVISNSSALFELNPDFGELYLSGESTFYIFSTTSAFQEV